MLEFLPERITRSKEHSGALRYVLMILRIVEKITNCITDPWKLAIWEAAAKFSASRDNILHVHELEHT